KGMFDDALVEHEKWAALTGNKVEAAVTLAQLYAVWGRTEEARRLVADIERDKLVTQQVSRGLGLGYVALGEAETAFGYLEESYARREESILSLKVDPKMDALRSDPRFMALLRKIGLEK